jgi:hypothetical protein
LAIVISLLSSYQFITHDTDLLCYSVLYMFKITAEMLVLAKPPQKLLSRFNVPVAKVADMIREGTVEMMKLENEMLHSPNPQKTTVEMGDLSRHHLFFTARRHLYKRNVYVVRITYRFQKTPRLKQKCAVVILGVEIMKEKDYQPVLLSVPDRRQTGQ